MFIRKVKNYRSFLISGLMISAINHSIYAQDTVEEETEIDQSITAEVGSAYFTPIKEFGQKCVSFKSRRVGDSRGKIELHRAYSLEQLYKRFQLTVNGKVGIGWFKSEFSSDFAKETQVDDYSESLTFRSSFDYGQIKYDDHGGDFLIPRYRQILEDYSNDRNGLVEFRKRCGDQMVSAQTMGGEIFIQAGFRFHSKSDKQTFTGEFRANVPFGQLSAEIQRVSNALNIKGSVSIRALQLGGDPGKMGELFETDGDVPAVDCSFNNLARCTSMFAKIIAYAGNFSKQLDIAKPETLAVLSNSFEQYNHFEQDIPEKEEASAVVELARKNLVERQQAYIKESNFIKTLLTQSIPPHRKNPIIEIEKIVAHNIDILNTAGLKCFSMEEYKNCPALQQQAFKDLINYSRIPLEMRREEWHLESKNAGIPTGTPYSVQHIHAAFQTYELRREVHKVTIMIPIPYSPGMITKVVEGYLHRHEDGTGFLMTLPEIRFDNNSAFPRLEQNGKINATFLPGTDRVTGTIDMTIRFFHGDHPRSTQKIHHGFKGIVKFER